MARKKRIWFAGAKYHVTSRGIRKSALFFDESDCLKYMDLLRTTMVKLPFVLHSYCLMSNHIHLQIETLQHPIGLIMKQLHVPYAKFFNEKYGFTGHVFEGRFGSELLDTIGYELEVNRYIHLNPVRAKLVLNPADYPWSSYPQYVKTPSATESIVHSETILSCFPEPKIENYQKFLKSKVSISS